MVWLAALLMWTLGELPICCQSWCHCEHGAKGKAV